jgi:outer membrane protein assembly factor BamB
VPDGHPTLRRYGLSAALLLAVTLLGLWQWAPARGARVDGVQAAPARSAEAPPVATPAPQDWPEFLGNASRSGLQITSTLLSAATAGSLVPVTGPGFGQLGAVISSPAVYQGIVYYASDEQVVTTTNGVSVTAHIGLMLAVSTTGQVVWTRRFPVCGTSNAPQFTLSSPAVGLGRINGVSTPQVFIGWGEATGCVYDFNALTGALIWEYPLPDPVMGSPALMPTNSGPLVVVGANDDTLHAFSLNYTGPMSGSATQVWQYNDQQDPPPPGYAQYCDPEEVCGDSIWGSVSEGIVMVNGARHHYAFFPIGASPTHTVGRLDAVDMDNIVNGSPTLAWAFWDPHVQPDNDFSLVQTLTDRNGNALRVFTAQHYGHMYSLDPATGHLVFDFNAAAALGEPLSMLNGSGAFANVNGTYAYIFGTGCSVSTWQLSCGTTTSYGSIVAINAMTTTASGALLWSSPNLGGELNSSPAAINLGANAVIFALGPYSASSPYRGDLLALNPATGALLADYPVNGHAWGTIGSLAVYGNKIFVPEGYGIIDDTYGQLGALVAFTCAGCP